MPKCRHSIVWWRGWGRESSSLDAPIDAFHYIVSPIHTRNKIKTKCFACECVCSMGSYVRKTLLCVCVCQRHIPIAISLCENPISLLTFFPFVRFYFLWGGCCFLLLYIIIGFCASTHTHTHTSISGLCIVWMKWEEFHLRMENRNCLTWWCWLSNKVLLAAVAAVSCALSVRVKGAYRAHVEYTLATAHTYSHSTQHTQANGWIVGCECETAVRYVKLSCAPTLASRKEKILATQSVCVCSKNHSSCVARRRRCRKQ